jgi:PAS domain S-box-containing protein
MDYDSLKRIVERQNRIIEATGLGTWEYNFQTTELIINEHWAQILGYKLAELGPINMAEFRKFVNPDDYKVAFQKFHDHIQGKTEFYETEVRLKHRAGHWIWVLDKGKIVSHTADGKAEWLMGSHQEITTRKNNEVLLTHYRELLQRTKEVALIGSWELNLMDAAVTWNPMARKIYEVDRNFALTFDQYVTFYPDGANRQKIRDLISNAVTSGQAFDEELPIYYSCRK